MELLLTERMGFPASDLKKLEAGSSVIKTIDTPVREELAYVAAVFIDASAKRFIERFSDVATFEAGPGVPQVGRFSSPARLEDMASLTLPPEEVEALSKCRPGRCDLKLPANAIVRFRDEVDWSSPDAASHAGEVVKEMLLELLRAYRRGGDVALGDYYDDKERVSPSEQFPTLVDDEDPLPVYVPELIDYLRDYPRNRPHGAESFFYWTVADFGLKKTIRLNHVTVYTLDPARESAVASVIAIKQLYASHYFNATLELRFLINDRRRPEAQSICLVSIVRSRNDGMTGLKGLFLRPIIRPRSREAVRRYLEHAKSRTENDD